MNKNESVKLKSKLKKIKIVLTDVDGVLTDGGRYYTSSGEKFKKFHVDDRITIVKGFIEESLPTITNKTFSFAFIDTAAYDSMKVGLEFIFPRLSINGIVAVDDYSKSDQEYATKQAVDEFCEAHNLKLNLKPFAHILKEI